MTIKIKETAGPAAEVSSDSKEKISRSKGRKIVNRAAGFSDSADITEIPELTIETIEKILNDNIAGSNTFTGHFKVGGMLGSGGFSTVYSLRYIQKTINHQRKDYQLSLKKLAVKVYDPVHLFLEKHKNYLNRKETSLRALKLQPKFQDLLQQRNEALSRINHVSSKIRHQNIVEYYPAFSLDSEDPVPFVTLTVQEEVICTLTEILPVEDKDTMIRLILKVGREIGGALQASEYAKKKADRFNHRDISKDNIGIRFTGKSPEFFEFVLIDWENGRPFSSEESLTVLGNDDNRAPELSKREGSVNDEDYRLADQFSLGTVLAAIVDPRKKTGYRDTLPEDIADVLDTCLKDTPENRYRDYEDFMQALEEAGDNYLSSFTSEGAYEKIRQELEKAYQAKLKEKDDELRKKTDEFTATRNNLNGQLNEANQKINARDLTISSQVHALSEKDQTISDQKVIIRDQNQTISKQKRSITDLNTKYEAEHKTLQNTEKKLKAAEEELKEKQPSDKSIREKDEIIKNLNLSIDALQESVNNAFAKKEKPEESTARLKQITTTVDGKQTSQSLYKYSGTGKTYSVTVEHTASGGSYRWSEKLEYENSKLQKKTVFRSPKADPVITEYTYTSEGRKEKTYRDSQIVNTLIFKDDLLSQEIVFNRGDKKTYTYSYDYSFGELMRINLHVSWFDDSNQMQTKDELICSVYHDYWPDRSIRTENIMPIRKVKPFDYYSCQKTYTIDGFLQSELIKPDLQSKGTLKQYFYDKDGRLIHLDTSMDGKLRTSSVYKYDDDGRKSEYIEIDHISGSISRSVYEYLPETKDPESKWSSNLNISDWLDLLDQS